MNKSLLLKAIAETAYNVGYGAKLNFATLDIIEKVPGLLGFISLAVGVYALFIPALTDNQMGAILVLFGIVSLYLAMYQNEKQRYDEVGKALTGKFNELKTHYYTAKSRPDSADFSDLIQAHNQIQIDTVNMTLSKQVMFSDWYAHYKFFWQQQIDWLDEQLHFRFCRDKVPLSAWIVSVLIVVGTLTYVVSHFNIAACLTR